MYDHNRPVSIISYKPMDGHMCAKIVDAVVCYDDPHNEQKFLLMINQEIQISELVDHLLCPMKYYYLCSNKYTTYATHLVDILNATLLLIISLQQHDVAIYFTLCSTKIAEYENEEISTIHLTAEIHLRTHQKKNTQKERLI